MKNFFIVFLSFILAFFVSCKKKSADAPLQATAEKKVTCSRVITLTPSGAQILVALGEGGRIVAKCDFCDDEGPLATVPIVGGFDGKLISTEKLLSYNPDFVYGARGMHDWLEVILSEHGVTLFLSSAQSIDDVLLEIKTIGALTQKSDAAAALCQKISSNIKLVTARAKSLIEKSGTPLRVLTLVWLNPFISVGRGSFIADIIKAAGGINVFDDLKTPYPQVSAEAIKAREADLIMVSAKLPLAVDEIASNPIFKNLKAIKTGRITPYDDDLLSRPGPNIDKAVQSVFEALYGKELDSD